MEEQREVFKERAIEFAKDHNIHKVFETSAKTGNNVEEVFSCAAREIFMQVGAEDDGSDDDVKGMEGTTAGGPKKRSSKTPGTDGKFDLGKKSGAGGTTKKNEKKGGCC